MKKICTKCKIELDLDSFTKSKNSKDGYFYICKDCESLRKKQFYLDGYVNNFSTSDNSRA